MSVTGRGLGRTRRIRVLTEDAVRTETRVENSESVGRKRVGVREETRYWGVSERPRYESDASLLLPISINDNGRNVLLAD
jgi:hypothetical protein